MSLLAICRKFKDISLPLVRRSRFKFPKILTSTIVDENTLPPRVKIDKETVEHLERLSLVNFANERGVKRLEEAIRFADRLSLIDTTGVDPLISVLENEVLYLREDKVTEGSNRKVVMSSAAVTEEDYYVAPPGNIPLDSKDLDKSK